MARHATFLARMTGPKYDPGTLEVPSLQVERANEKILAPTNEAFCYWDDDDKQFLSQENVPTDQEEMENITKIHLDREWALGVFCHHRAEIAHYFYHWRYHLREQVKLALTAVGRFSVAFKENVQGLSTEMQNQYSSGWRSC